MPVLKEVKNIKAYIYCRVVTILVPEACYHSCNSFFFIIYSCSCYCHCCSSSSSVIIIVLHYCSCCYHYCSSSSGFILKVLHTCTSFFFHHRLLLSLLSILAWNGMFQYLRYLVNMIKLVSFLHNMLRW
jgi:hypothetical protein